MSVSKSQGNLVSLLGGSVIDYVETTSNTSITATTEASSTTIVTSNSVLYDGTTTILIEFWTSYVSPTVSNVTDLVYTLWEDSTDLGLLGIHSWPSNASNQREPYSASRRLTPSAGSHTYSIRAYKGAGTPTVGAGGGGIGGHLPGYIRITRESSLIGSSGMANVQGGYAPLGSDLGLIQTFTPTWSSAGTPPTLSNGTIVGHYQRIADKLYWFSILLTYGSSSSPGTGNYLFSGLPFTIKSTSPAEQTLPGHLRDTGTARYPATCVLAAGATTVSQIWIATSTVWATTAPITLATGDTFQVEGIVVTD